MGLYITFHFAKKTLYSFEFHPLSSYLIHFSGVSGDGNGDGDGLRAAGTPRRGGAGSAEMARRGGAVEVVRRGGAGAAEDGGRRSRARQLPPLLLSAQACVLASVRALQLASSCILPRANRAGRPPLPAARVFAAGDKGIQLYGAKSL